MRLLKAKWFPAFAFLLAVIVGLFTHIIGSTVGEAVLVGVVTELILNVHSLKVGQSRIEELLGSSEGIETVSKILASASKVKKADNIWADKLLSQLLQRSWNDISLLESGKLELTPDHFMEFSKIVFLSMGKMDTLYATSLFGGGEYWRRMYGVKYSELNERAARNGARIIRMFIPRDECQKAQLACIYSNQSSYSEIRLCDHAKLMDFDAKAAGDFFILNRSLAAEFIFKDEELTHLEKILVVTHPTMIEAYQKRMDAIHGISERYTAEISSRA